MSLHKKPASMQEYVKHAPWAIHDPRPVSYMSICSNCTPILYRSMIWADRFITNTMKGNACSIRGTEQVDQVRSIYGHQNDVAIGQLQMAGQPVHKPACIWYLLSNQQRINQACNAQKELRIYQRQALSLCRQGSS